MPFTGERAARHIVVIPPPDGSGGARGNIVVREPKREDGDDPVKRREMLTGAAVLVGTTVLSGQAPARRALPRIGGSAALEDVLYRKTEAVPVPLSRLRVMLDASRAEFRNARYGRLPNALSGLIAAAHATAEDAGSTERAAAKGLLADAYILAADFAVKINDDPLSWMTADRALNAAQAGEDPLTLADARRAVAVAMRRSGHPGRACDLLVRACRDIEPASPDELAMYGTLLNVAAYTAATGGSRRGAEEYISEAAATSGRLGSAVSPRQPTFGPAGVSLYQVSIAQVLGDNGTAVEHARKLRPGDFPTPEREGRYWVDVARAFHQWGKAESCYAALLAADRAAPAEVRYRPPVHRMAEELLRRPGPPMPGLLAFAQRIGVPDT